MPPAKFQCGPGHGEIPATRVFTAFREVECPLINGERAAIIGHGHVEESVLRSAASGLSQLTRIPDKMRRRTRSTQVDVTLNEEDGAIVNYAIGAHVNGTADPRKCIEVDNRTLADGSAWPTHQ